MTHRPTFTTINFRSLILFNFFPLLDITYGMDIMLITWRTQREMRSSQMKNGALNDFFWLEKKSWNVYAINVIENVYMYMEAMILKINLWLHRRKVNLYVSEVMSWTLLMFLVFRERRSKFAGKLVNNLWMWKGWGDNFCAATVCGFFFGKAFRFDGD